VQGEANVSVFGERVLRVRRETTRERIHAIKQVNRIPNDADLIFDATGGAYHPHTGELLGLLTEGGAR